MRKRDDDRPVVMDPTTRWVGWLRVTTGGAWQPLCHGADYGGVMGELLALSAGRGRHVELEVLREGQTPTDRPRGGASARLRR